MAKAPNQGTIDWTPQEAPGANFAVGEDRGAVASKTAACFGPTPKMGSFFQKIRQMAALFFVFLFTPIILSLIFLLFFWLSHRRTGHWI
jgi:hypothetical protein